MERFSDGGGARRDGEECMIVVCAFRVMAVGRFVLMVGLRKEIWRLID